MLETLNPQPQDKILQLIAMFRDDPRDGKIDLGVGVYKDATGLTPVMRAVKAAEKKLWDVEKTKSYTGLAGEPAFNATMVGLILGDGFADRAASIATSSRPRTSAMPLLSRLTVSKDDAGISAMARRVAILGAALAPSSDQPAVSRILAKRRLPS